MTVLTPTGEPIPLRFIGKWSEVESLRSIEHRDLLRMFRNLRSTEHLNL